MKKLKPNRMWANAQCDGRPVEHRWRPLFNVRRTGLLLETDRVAWSVCHASDMSTPNHYSHSHHIYDTHTRRKTFTNFREYPQNLHITETTASTTVGGIFNLTRPPVA